jgi:hypothetical protein
MSYADLELQSGNQVAAIWERSLVLNSPERERLRQALMDYCSRDTLALANLVAVLKRYADSQTLHSTGDQG